MSANQNSVALWAIPVALAAAIIIGMVVILQVAPPCEGRDFRFKIGGDQYLFFECVGVPPTPAVNLEPTPVKEPLPVSLVLQGTSHVLAKKREATVCSPPQTSRDCHNKRDGEDGCPSFHTFSVTASTPAGKLRDPKVDCVRDNQGSCEWNAGSGHFSSATWDVREDGRQIEYRVPVSSRSIVVRACATEDVYELVPKSVELERWSEFKDGETFTARVPDGTVGAFTVEWPNGQQSMSPGDSARSLVFLSKATVPRSHTDYTYEVKQ